MSTSKRNIVSDHFSDDARIGSDRRVTENLLLPIVQNVGVSLSHTRSAESESLMKKSLPSDLIFTSFSFIGICKSGGAIGQRITASESASVTHPSRPTTPTTIISEIHDVFSFCRYVAKSPQKCQGFLDAYELHFQSAGGGVAGSSKV